MSELHEPRRQAKLGGYGGYGSCIWSGLQRINQAIDHPDDRCRIGLSETKGGLGGGGISAGCVQDACR